MADFVTQAGLQTARQMFLWILVSVLSALPAFADCEVSPSALDFGDVPVGEAQVLSFQFENTGTDTLIGSLSEDCPAFRILPPESYEIAPGEMRVVEVEFLPQSEIEASCTIVVGHPDCADVLASGLGVNSPECELSTEELRFGEVEVGDSAELPFTIYNRGGQLLIGAVTFDCDEFTLIESDSSYSVAAGDSATFSLRFSPTAPGLVSCPLDLGVELCPDILATGTGIVLPVCETEVTPSDFGDVVLGETAAGEVRIENTGGGLLEGTLRIDCDDFALVDTEGRYELGPGESVTFAVEFSPMEIREYVCGVDSGNCEFLLQGRGIGIAVCEIDPASLDFGIVEVGSVGELAFTISNSGTASMSGIVTESCGPFAIVGDASYELGPGESADIIVRFAPEASGSQACALSPGSPTCSTIEVVGRGFLQPECRVSAAELDFGSVTVDSFVDRVFEVENVGGGRLQGSVTISCDHFEIEGTADYDLGPLEIQAFVIRYRPSEEGAHSCTIDSGSGCSPVAASGSGTLDPVCVVEPGALDFGDVPIGEAQFRSLTVRNDGGGEITGGFSSDCPEFALVGETSFELAAGESIELRLRFLATEPDFYSCSLTSSSSACSPVLLTAEVLEPPVCDVAPLLLDFGTVTIDDFMDREVVVTNRGGGILSGALSASCEFFAVVDADPGYVLDAHASKAFTLRYSPTEEGASTCLLEVGGDCSDVQLRGSAAGLPEPICEISSSEIRFGSIRLGESSSALLWIENVGEGVLVGTATLPCSEFSLRGDPSYALSAGETHEFELVFTPTRIGATACQLDLGVAGAGPGALAIDSVSGRLGALGSVCLPVSLSGEGVDVRDCIVTPATLDFGTVDVGTQVEETVTLVNTGEGTLSGAVTILGSCDDVFIVGPSAYSLLPGKEQTFRVRFEPVREGARSCTIETGSDACFDVPFRATGVFPPFCEVSTRFLNFGKVQVGSSVDLTFRIANTGGGPLIGEIQMLCPDWSLLEPAGYEIDSGDDRVFTVRFAPTTSGSANCEIRLGSERCGSITAIATVEPPPVPVCSFSPQLMDFGAAQVGSGVYQTIVLQNVGEVELSGALTTDCLQFRVVNDAVVQLEPGEEQSVEIRFEPSVIGPIECRLLLDDCGGIGAVLQGRGEVEPPPLCSLSTSDLDFGGVPLGEGVTRALVIRNVGGGRLEGDIRVGCPDFELLGSDVYSLGPDEWHSVELRFLPRDPKEVSCLLDIGRDSCGPITLRGHGVSSRFAVCSVEPESIDFGDVELGTSVELELEVTNAGSGFLVGTLRLHALDVTLPEAPVILLGAGESQRFAIRYEPTRLAVVQEEIQISEACPVLPVSGRSIPEADPLCRLEPLAFDFGRVLTGERRVLPVTLHNDGGGVLRGRFEANCPGYSVLDSGDYELVHGESITFNLEYTAGSEIAEERCLIEVHDCAIEVEAIAVRSRLELEVDAGTFRPFGFGVTVVEAGELLSSLGRLGVDYELWRWSETDLAYLRWSTLSTPVAESFQTAAGFWLESKVDSPLRWSGDPVLEADLRYPLTPGWTQFSSFFQIPIEVSTLQVADGVNEVFVVSADNTLTDPAIWKWNGVEFEPAEVLRPFASYWIRTRPEPGPVRGGGRNVELIFDLAADPTLIPRSLPAWEFYVAAQQGAGDPVHASIGASVEDTDFSLQAVPAPPFAAMQLRVQEALRETADSDAQRDLFHSLYRPEASVMVFDFVLDGIESDKPVTLEFTGENLPHDATFVLTHWARRVTRAVSPAGSVRLDPLGDELEFRMVVSFAGPDSIPPESIPPEIALTHYPIAQPNPFFTETELRFVLFETGDLTIEVFDPHGRRVRTMFRPGLPAGEVSVLWDGTDDHGNRVQSGVYLARFTAGGATRTMRVVRVG